MDRARRTTRRDCGGTADEIADRIHDALEAILPFEHRDDDIALLVLTVAAMSATSTG